MKLRAADPSELNLALVLKNLKQDMRNNSRINEARQDLRQHTAITTCRPSQVGNSLTTKQHSRGRTFKQSCMLDCLTSFRSVHPVSTHVPSRQIATTLMSTLLADEAIATRAAKAGLKQRTLRSAVIATLAKTILGIPADSNSYKPPSLKGI